MAKDGVSITMKGVDELQAALAEFSAASQRRIARPAIREASTPVLRAIRQKAPRKNDKRTGLLRKSIGRVIRTYKSGTVLAVIGSQRDVVGTDEYGNKVVPANYAHLYEFGTAAHSLGAGSSGRKGVAHGRRHPGAKPHPFMRPAWEENRERAMTVMRQRMFVEIEKEAVRVRAKAAKRGKK